MSTNLEKAYTKIECSGLSQSEKYHVKREASKNSGVAEGIKLQNPCTDEFLLGFIAVDTTVLQLEKLLSKLNTNKSNNLSPTCPSMSTFGRQLDSLFQKEQLPITEVATKLFHKNIFYKNEEEFNEGIYECFYGFSELTDEENDIIIVNSERTLWLSDGINNDIDEDRRKPDFFRIHKAFFKPAVHPHGMCKYYGGLLDTIFIEQVLFIYEGKLDSVDTDTNKGIFYNYLNLLSNCGAKTPRGILYNPTSFVIGDICELKCYCGDWDYTLPSILTEMIESVPLPKLTAALIDACREFGVQTTLGGYIGRGSSGFCFKVINKAGTSGNIMVLKIILSPNLLPKGHFETIVRAEYINGITLKKSLSDIVVHIFEDKFVLKDDHYGSILFLEYASAVKFAFQRLTKMIKLLNLLHKADYSHGDARVANIVEFQGGQYKFIDFATITRFDSYIDQKTKAKKILDDVKTLCTSILTKQSLDYSHNVFTNYCRDCTNEAYLNDLVVYINNHK